jgi:predicted RNA polymerase sigma factor
VLYLIFNEGYATTSGPSLQRGDLTSEAIRLARMVHRLLPDDSEVTGLLALMLLTDARQSARTGPQGELIPMAEQDRSQWNADEIAEGIALITAALPRGPIGPYQLQAAIAAVHDEALLKARGCSRLAWACLCSLESVRQWPGGRSDRPRERPRLARASGW